MELTLLHFSLEPYSHMFQSGITNKLFLFKSVFSNLEICLLKTTAKCKQQTTNKKNLNLI